MTEKGCPYCSLFGSNQLDMKNRPQINDAIISDIKACHDPETARKVFDVLEMVLRILRRIFEAKRH